MTQPMIRHIAIAWGISLVTACGGNKFAGQAGHKEADNSGSPANSSQPPTTINNPNGNASIPGSSSNPISGSLNTQQTDCLLKKADKYNILMVFDNSNSTNNTDPSNVRQQGALQFAKKFIDFGTANPSADIKLGVIRFSSTASRGAHGWMKLAASAESDINSDIIMATTNKTLGTEYEPAVSEAQRMMTEVGASAGDKRQRNYVIFMSDGRPTGLPDSKVPPLFDPVVNSNGAAVFGIAVGPSSGPGHLYPANEKVMQDISKPQTGIVSPKHVGLYLRAVTASDLLTAYSRVADVISGCE